MEKPYNAFRKHRIIFGMFGVLLPGDVERFWLRILVDTHFVQCLFSIALWCVLYVRGAILYTHDHLLDRMVGLAAAISGVASIAKLLAIRMNAGVLAELIGHLGFMKCNTALGKRVRKVTGIFEVSVAMIILTHNTDYWTHSEPTRQSPFYTATKTGELREVTRDYFFTLYGATLVIVSNVIGDTLFIILASQVCYRLHRLTNTIPFIGKEWDPGDLDVIEVDGDITTELELVRACIKEHNLILKLTSKIEDLYYVTILCQLFYSFLSICLTLFTVAQFDNVVAGFKEMTPQVVSLFLEFFLYCWAGQTISDHFEKLHFAVYNSNWIECQKETKSAILIMEAITAQPRHITAGSVYPLTYHFFETICKETFSAYTIMYQFLA